jgi:hypothetical protein
MARLGTLSLGDCASWCAFVPAPDSWLGSSCADCISVTGAGTETPGTDDSAPAATPAVQAPTGGIAPNCPCYDATHDAGLIHCASATSVIANALNPFSQQMTTNCSASETACLQTTPTATLLSCANTDPCTGAIGISCSTLALYAVIGVVAFIALKK